MKRILESFKNLYKGPDVVKTHLLLAAMFIIPGLLGATSQFLDKEFKEYFIPILIVVGVLLILSTIPALFVSGYYIKFMNKRFYEPIGIPNMDLDCFIQGVKVLPLYIVWCLYIGIPVLLYVAAIIGGVIFYLSTKPDDIFAILAIVVMFGLLLLLFIPIFLISPFVSGVYITYAKDIKYSRELFNPFIYFGYMKKAFKELIFVALRFFVVSIVGSFVVQIVGLVAFLLIMIVAAICLIFASGTESNNVFTPASIVIIIFLGALVGLVQGYVTQIVAFAYSDNLIEVYKEKGIISLEDSCQNTPDEGLNSQE